MKISFLSFSHRYDDTRILHKMARSLANEGFDVSHIAPEVEEEKNSSHWVQNGVNIEIYPVNGTGLLGRFKRFRNLYRKAIQVDADCYQCNEIESWVVGLLIKMVKRNKKVIFDVHEHYPSRFDEPHIKRWVGVIGKPILFIMFKLLPCWTDHLIFAKRSIAPDFSGNTQKQSFIFNYSPLWLSGRDREEVDSSIRSQFEGKVVALHIGGFSRTRGWPQMLDALALMQNKELVILCFGKVDEGEGAFLGKAREVGVEHRVHLRSPIPYEQVFDYLLCADIGLMLYQPGIQNHIFAFPMKMYDYMLARLPFVGPNFSIEVIPVVEEETCGLLVNTGSAEEIATALDWLCDNLDEAKEMGCRGRRAAITKYNWESEAEKFIQIYKGFAGSNKINIYRCFTTVYEAVQIWKLT